MVTVLVSEQAVIVSQNEVVLKLVMVLPPAVTFTFDTTTLHEWNIVEEQELDELDELDEPLELAESEALVCVAD